MFELIFNGILAAIILFLFIVLSYVWPPDSPWAPWWKISKKKSLQAAQLVSVSKKDRIYELGSGDGEFLLTIAKEYGCACVGIEIDPIRHYQSRLRAWFRKLGTITFIKKNFFDVTISDATIVFVYLVPKALGRLLPKFQKELKKGTIIISYKYELPLHSAQKKIQRIKTRNDLEVFVYKVL